MPPASTVIQAGKAERDERLKEALKAFILKERQRKKEEHEAEVEEERLRKEREARERQDVMTLGETREQITKLDQKLTELRNQKQQLFLQLKKVLNEDENRKKQQQQKESEMFALQALQAQNVPQPQVFLPQRLQHQQILQKVPVGVNPQGLKRNRSPSPPTHQAYYKTAPYGQQKHDDGRRGADIARVLWNKPPTQYQTPPGTLFFQTTSNPPGHGQQDGRGPAIIYPSYNPNLNIPLRQSYHMEMQAQPPPGQGHTSKGDQTSQKPSQVYHINLDQPPITQASGSVAGNQQHKPQVTMEKISERGYHVELKVDQSGHGPPQPTHLPETVVYTSLISGLPIHPGVMQMTGNPPQNAKPGGSITQGYSQNRTGAPHQQAQQQQITPQQQPTQQLHYPRRLF